MGHTGVFFFLSLLATAAQLSYSNDRPQSITPTGRQLAQQDEIPVSNTDELKEALKDVQSGQTIILMGKNKFKLSESLWIQQHNVRLKGESRDTTTLVCPPDDNILNIKVRNVTIASLTLEGCSGLPAVMITLDNNDSPYENVVFDQVAFRHNSNFEYYAPEGGGAISARGHLVRWWPELIISPLNVTIEDCVFEDNKADMGGAVYGEECTLEVLRSTFMNNLGRRKGGAIFVTEPGSQLVISDSHFRNNTVIEDGPNIPVHREGGELIEHDRYFIFRSPDNGGGAIAVTSIDRLNVIRTHFLKNRATSGGAIHATFDALELQFTNSTIISARIEECRFEENQAEIIEGTALSDPEENIGGAVYFASATAKLKTLEILRTTFKKNHAESSGGALHIVTVHLDDIDIDGCVFDGNRAERAGGAALLRNSGDILLRNTTWSRNAAGLGGAIMVTNGAKFTAKPVLDSSGNENSEIRNLFEENSAVDGAGLMCAGCGTLLLKNVDFQKNKAKRVGGGLFVLDSAHDVRVEQSHFYDNVALHGGGAAMRSAESVILGSAKSDWWNEFLRNRAVTGGGVFVEGNRQKENTLQLKHSRFIQNHAIDANDLRAELSAEIPTFRRHLMSTSVSNVDRMEWSTQDDTITGDFLRHCGNGGGGGVCLAFDNVPDGAMADVSTRDTYFEHNEALIGGGMFLSVAGNWITGNKTNCESDTLSIEPCRLFHLFNMTFASNTGKFGAGGLFVTDPEKVIVGCGTSQSHVVHWKQLSQAHTDSRPLKDCFLFEKNRVLESGGIYGPDMASRVDSLQIVDPESGNITGHRGGARLLPPCNDMTDCEDEREDGIKIEVRDAFNQTITGGIPDAGLTVLALSADILGEQTYRAKKGTININQTKGVGVNQTSVIEFRYQRTDRKHLQVNLTFTTRECVPGEIETDIGCMSCVPDRYSFNTSSVCLDCEEHAHCSGGSVLVPEDGYWHSTPFSPQFHECIIKEACVYENRTEKLAKYYEDATFLTEDLKELDQYVKEREEGGEIFRPEFDTYNQCAEGYKSVLCGSCEDGYGRLDGGKCQKCPSEWRIGLIPVVFSFALSVILIGIQIRTSSFSQSENITVVSAIAKKAAAERQREGTSFMRLEDVFPDTGQHTPPTSSRELGDENSAHPLLTPHGEGRDPRSNMQNGTRIPPRPLRRVYAFHLRSIRDWWSWMPSPITREPLVTDHVDAREKLSEILKIFVNYFQVTGTALDISVPWFTPMRFLLSLQNLCASFSSGIFLVPLECMFRGGGFRESSTSKSIHIFWLRVLYCLLSLFVLFVFERMCDFISARSKKKRGTISTASTSRTAENGEHVIMANNESELMENGNNGSAGDHGAQREREGYSDLQEQRKQARSDSTAGIVVVILVFIFQAYSTITEAFMEAVNCLEVDASLNQDQNDIHSQNERYAIETVSRVWIEDTSLYCYQGTHLITGMAGCVGLFSSFLFIIWISLWIHANKTRWQDPVFIKRYGFLYNSYRQEGWAPYWESMVFLRKALIQAAVVFAIRLGPNLQSITALGVLLLAFVAHWIIKPFAEYKDHPNVPGYCGKTLERFLPGILCWSWKYLLEAISLNGLETTSMFMSISVFYTGIISNDPNVSDGAKDAVVVCTFAVNLLFILYVLHRLYAGTHLALDMYITYLIMYRGCPLNGSVPRTYDNRRPEDAPDVTLLQKAKWIRDYLTNCSTEVNKQEDVLYEYVNRDRSTV